MEDNRTPEQKRLQPFFDLVCDPKDWRAPINKIVDQNADLELIREAIIFYTATVPKFKIVNDGYLVYSDGYRNGPAGDH
jgi:hypothetical protein